MAGVTAALGRKPALAYRVNREVSALVWAVSNTRPRLNSTVLSKFWVSENVLRKGKRFVANPEPGDDL